MRKSSGSETTFARDSTDAAEIEAQVAGQADDVWDWAERTGTSGRTVTVKAKYADFRIVTRSRSFASPVPSRAALHATARELIGTLYPLDMGLRLVGVTMSNLARMDEEVEPLLV